MSDEQGRDLKALADQPETDDHLVWVYRAFWDLCGDRQVGFGEGPIMWISVDAYARRHRIRDDQFDRLWMLLQRMDRAYLKERADQAKKPSK